MPSLPPTVVTIGNFDGLHLGHQQLLKKVSDISMQKGLKKLAISFSPRPSAYFKQKREEALLFSRKMKEQAFRELGFDYLLIQSFDQEFSQLSHGFFYEQLLRAYLNAHAIVVGYDFCFGKQRLGTSQWLESRGTLDGVDVFVFKPLTNQGLPISSTRVRHSVISGDLELASKLLGRPYLLQGRVEKGRQIGRTINSPTVNIRVKDQLLPANGVYTARVFLKAKNDVSPAPIFQVNDCLPAVVNIGTRPTVEKYGRDVTVEAHILGKNYRPNELYDLNLGIYFYDFIREEKKFDSLDLLKKQIARDIEQARQLLGV